MPRRRSKTPSSVANKTQGTERSSKNLHTAQAAATTATTTPAIALSSPVASRASFPGAVRHERPSRSSASSPSPSPMDPVFETGFHDLISRNAGPTGVINPDTVWALTRDQMARETSPDDEEEFRRPVLGSQYRREPERDYLEGEHDHLGDEQDHLDREQGSQSRKRRLPHEPIGEAVEEADRRAESPEEDNRDRDTFMFQHQTYRTVQYQTAQFPSGLPLGLYAFAHGNGNAHGVGPYADGPYPDIVTSEMNADYGLLLEERPLKRARTHQSTRPAPPLSPPPSSREQSPPQGATSTSSRSLQPPAPRRVLQLRSSSHRGGDGSVRHDGA